MNISEVKAIMAEQQKSTGQKAARGAQVVGGIIKIATGIASQNYAQAIIGAIEVIPWKKVFTVIGALLFLLLIPIIIIASLPQLLVNWALSGFDDLISRNEHAAEMESYYYEVLDEQQEGVEPDITRLICIQAVQKQQQVEAINESDVEYMIDISFSVDEDGKVYNKTPDEIMDEMGFDDEQKNWANLMYNVFTGQKITPDSEFVDKDRLKSYEGVDLDGLTYFNQLDERWANEMYGKTDTIGVAGCGPTALAIAITNLTGEETDPVEVAEWSYENGYVCEGSGSYISLIPNAAEHFGLSVEKLGKSSAEELIQHLADGKMIIAIMGAGHFTNSGHFIVLRGVTGGGKILVADPVSYNKSIMEWDVSIILSEAKNAGSGGPFWSLSLPKPEEE